MGIPTSLALHLEALHGLVAVESVLDAARQHVVDSGVTIGRWRTLEKYKLRTTFSLRHGAPEDIFLLPHLQHVIIRLHQIQAFVFGKSLAHKYRYFLVLILNDVQRYAFFFILPNFSTAKLLKCANANNNTRIWEFVTNFKSHKV